MVEAVTLSTYAGALPRHQYVLIEPNAIGKHDWLKAVWFGLVSHPGRTWGCHVLLECGAVYRNVPLHKLAQHQYPILEWQTSDAQTWDCYGPQFSVLEYPYLAGLTTRVRTRAGTEHEGAYLFTAVPVGDAFSQVPEQSKEFYFVALENGRYTAQPTNHCLIEERSFTREIEWPKFLRRQTDVFSAE